VCVSGVGKSSSATLCDIVRGFRRVGSLKTHGKDGDMQIYLVLGSGMYELSRNELLPPYERKRNGRVGWSGTDPQKQLHTADRTGPGGAAAADMGLLPLQGVVSICILRMEMYKKTKRSEIKGEKKQKGKTPYVVLVTQGPNILTS